MSTLLFPSTNIFCTNLKALMFVFFSRFFLNLLQFFSLKRLREAFLQNHEIPLNGSPEVRLMFITICCYGFLLLIIQFDKGITPYWDEFLSGITFATFASFDQIRKNISLPNVYLMIHKLNSTGKVRNSIVCFFVVIRGLE